MRNVMHTRQVFTCLHVYMFQIHTKRDKCTCRRCTSCCVHILVNEPVVNIVIHVYIQGLKFISFPYLLTLQLKRFAFDYATLHRVKLNDRLVLVVKNKFHQI